MKKALFLVLLAAFQPAIGQENWTFPATLQEASRQVKGMRTIRPNQSIASSWLYVPAAVNAPGLYGSFFKTRLTIVHLGTTPAEVEVSFYSSGTPRQTKIRLEPAETKTYWNVLDDLFHTQGTGGLELNGPYEHDMVASSEVYIDGPAGRFSTATTVYTILDNLGSTYLDWTTGVTVNSTTRANIACVNFSSSAAIVKAALYDAPSPGRLLKEFQFDLSRYQWVQLAVDVQVTGGTILWKPFGGENYCYAVNVNNQSNDGTFLDRTTYVE